MLSTCSLRSKTLFCCSTRRDRRTCASFQKGMKKLKSTTAAMPTPRELPPSLSPCTLPFSSYFPPIEPLLLPFHLSLRLPISLSISIDTGSRARLHHAYPPCDGVLMNCALQVVCCQSRGQGKMAGASECGRAKDSYVDRASRGVLHLWETRDWAGRQDEQAKSKVLPVVSDLLQFNV